MNDGIKYRVGSSTMRWAGVLGIATTLACGDDGSSLLAPDSASTDRARYLMSCDFRGGSLLSMDIQVSENFGATWGPGVNPDITGVVADGSVTYYTWGTLEAPDYTFSFEGSSAFAEFWITNRLNNILVKWEPWDEGLIMEWDHFGRLGPTTRHHCRLTDFVPLPPSD